MTEKGVAYIFGILSIVLAVVLQPLPAIILGIIGLVQNKEDKSKTAKRLNTIGLVLGIVVLALTIGITVYYMSQGATGSFPVY